MDESDDFDPQDGLPGGGDGVSDAPVSSGTVEERLAALETAWRQMQVEWLSMYDQFRSLYGRIARRQQREEQVAEKPQERPLNPAALALLGHNGRAS